MNYRQLLELTDRMATTNAYMMEVDVPTVVSPQFFAWYCQRVLRDGLVDSDSGAPSIGARATAWAYQKGLCDGSATWKYMHLAGTTLARALGARRPACVYCSSVWSESAKTMRPRGIAR